MPCCNASSYLAITYHKEKQLTKVTEIMCSNCLNIISVYKAQLDRNKTATDSNEPTDNRPVVS